MPESQRVDHVERFRKYKPTPEDLYSKSTSVGRKPGDKDQKRHTKEPIFVEDRVTAEKCPKIIVKRTKENTFTSVVDFDLKKLNPPNWKNLLNYG